jgi:ferredoxin
MGAWSVAVDRDACIGSGMCTSTAPGRFVLGADGRSRAVEAGIDADPAVVAAAESCPAEAITVTEVSSGAVLAP